MASNSEIKARLASLRGEIVKHGLAGYLISTTDEYLSEYTPDYAKRLEYITGFSGSNGIAIILPETVMFFTDGRYLTQSREQLDQDEFEVFDVSEIKKVLGDLNRDLSVGLNKDDRKRRVQEPSANCVIPEPSIAIPDSAPESRQYAIGFDPKIFSPRAVEQLNTLNLKPTAENLIDKIWHDQPTRPASVIYEYTIEYAGQGYFDKVQQCRKYLEENDVTALVITNPEAVCWLVNIRAHDLEFTPLLLAYAVITAEQIYVFADLERVDKGLKANRPDVTFLQESEFENFIANLKSSCVFDPKFASHYARELLLSNNGREDVDPCQQWKAVKNDIEIKQMQQGHIQDAIAECEFFAMLDGLSEEERRSISEFDLGEKLTGYRQERPGYVMDSFPAIVGYQDNGAVIHYRAERDSTKKLDGGGLLLIDSGGHYMGATTDITRTVLVGDVPAEKLLKFRQHYTQVLKGHIALAIVKFPADKYCGGHLDILARQYLFANGLNYAHGTGHGVGAFLSVHEGPQNISPALHTSTINAGMVVSNEPGYYVPGEFGIRIENLMYAKQSEHEGFLEFEMLTLVPYCKELIEQDVLTYEELAYLEAYNKRIMQQVTPYLSHEAKRWVEKQLH